MYCYTACSDAGGDVPQIRGLQPLTEDDILSSMPVDQLSRSLSLPNAPLNTGSLSLPPSGSSSTYDTNIWPKPPAPPAEQLDSGDTDER